MLDVDNPLFIVEDLLVDKEDLMVVKTDLQAKLIYLMVKVKDPVTNMDDVIENNYLLNIKISNKSCLLGKKYKLSILVLILITKKTGYVNITGSGNQKYFPACFMCKNI